MQRSLLRFYLSKANLEAVRGERIKTLTECASKPADLHLKLVALLAHERSARPYSLLFRSAFLSMRALALS